MCDQCIRRFGATWHRYPGGNYGSRYYAGWHEGRRRSLHRVVWERYRGAIPPGVHVHHRNGNRTDNRIANLELVTPAEHGALHREYPDGCLEARKRRRRERRAGRVCRCGAAIDDEAKLGTKFCSNACKSAARQSSGVDNERRQCAICSAVFKVNRYAPTRTCSRACAGRASSRTKRRLQPDGRA